MKKLILSVLIAMLSTGAVAQSVTEKAASALGLTPSTKSFIENAAISDMFEIETSKIAQQKADEQSKTFASKMVKDHSEASAELKAIAAKANVEVPSALDSAHQSKLDKLKSLSGADFDKQYDADQLAAHKDAVSMFERYAQGGDNADLKAFATKHLPHLKEHLQMAESMQNSTTTGERPK
jgi:putative membrane protein